MMVGSSILAIVVSLAPGSSDVALAVLAPLRRPEVPTAGSASVGRNPIDAFLEVRLASSSLTPVAEADRATLIRRVTFDLTGLPPTPEAIAAFLADPSDRAYESLVDRLLESPAFGERFGRLWLDLARYTESQGFEYDRLRDTAWPYRDWVVAALNADLPYDRFMRMQIAGDVLEPVTRDGIVAAGFLVCGPWDEAGNSQANETQKAITRQEELEDLIGTVGQAFLGITVNCARCHDHKFDPIPRLDYYRLQSVFAGVRHGERPLLSQREQGVREARIKELEHAIGEREATLANLLHRVSDSASESLELGIDAAARTAESARLEREISTLREQRAAVKPLEIAYVGRREQPAPTRDLRRGDVLSPGEVVTPGGLSCVTIPSSDFRLAADAPEAERRIAFAEWIADRRNPLPARVMVNRLWHWHFGRGLIATPSDLGANAGAPSHPELLDWLASELLANDFRLKPLHRLIVTSAAYRRASTVDRTALAIDTDSRTLWRFPPRRLEAEMVRDALLAVSGALDTALGGPSFRPFQAVPFPANAYTPILEDRAEFHRRSLYRMNVNSGKDALLDVFDCPDPSIKTPVRGSTTTPLQALVLMNDPFVLREVARFAERVLSESDGDLRKAIERAFWLAFGRAPDPVEASEALRLVEAHGLDSLTWSLVNASEFVDVR